MDEIINRQQFGYKVTLTESTQATVSVSYTHLDVYKRQQLAIQPELQNTYDEVYGHTGSI